MAEQIYSDLNFTRSYEVSVWTLQDSFITVLKWANIEHKGSILNPLMSINTDGTLNFSFNIPMSLYIDGKWRENPLWYHTSDGTLITNMRKLKVIFNKKEEDEEVFEFLITKMHYSHSGDIPSCEISCDGGLAYHELGKQGYKISLSSEVFYEEDAAAFAEDEEVDSEEENNDEYLTDSDNSLHATLDYWCAKMDLERAQTNADIKDSRKWYYRVQMDWSSYANNTGTRASDKIYEEEYVASWDVEGKATRVETYKEKERLVDEENSNLYNLTLRVAETFGVFCRYQFLYDDNYHIIGKLIIFYNNFFNEREGVIQFAYPYTTTLVTREVDSTDIVTKMYVDNIEDDSVEGMISIMNTEANKMHEDYLLNFDYLHDVKTITEELYEAIKLYEEDIRIINEEIIPIQELLTALYKEQVDVEAKKTTADNGRVLAQERLDDNLALIDSLNGTDGTKDDVIIYDKSAPDHAVITTNEKGVKQISFKTKGILKNTIKLYSAYPIADDTAPLTALIDTNDMGLVSTAYGFNVPDTVKMLYMTYSYKPSDYYEKFRLTWEARLGKDEADFREYSARLEEIELEIEDLTEELQDLLDEKAEIIKEFTLMMGPALREGHWTPDDYSNYGDKYVKNLILPLYSENTELPINGPHAHHIHATWDNELFTDELHNDYTMGIQENRYFYPCIYLTDLQWRNVISALKEDRKLSILYYDLAVSNAAAEGENELFDSHVRNDSNWHILTIGSSALIIFLADGRAGVLNIRPAIIVTDCISMSNDEITHMKNTAVIAEVLQEVSNDGSTVTTTINEVVSLNPTTSWYTSAELLNNTAQIEPRLCIDTLGLKNNSNDLSIKYNGKLLLNYYDYSVLTRENTYLITFKPETLLMIGYEDGKSIQLILRCSIEVRYSISNASTAIYLDALLVHKENAYPKVSYTVSPSVINRKIIRRIYQYLNRIININDNELKLHDAFGYISALDLDLDHPWQDSITVQNYNNKFEDIFSTITALTEAMQRREYSLNETMLLVTTTGELDLEVLQNTIANNQFNYSFNDGQLTLTEVDGILGESSQGFINVRNNGIFTASERDAEGKWIWKTAILPEGINADLIKAGTLDTDKIMIYSGNDIRFQWNSEGLYAYKSILPPVDTSNLSVQELEAIQAEYSSLTNDVNSNLFVVFNSEGLSLVRKEWNFSRAQIIEDDTAFDPTLWDSINEINAIPAEGVKQVEVSWDGFKMRNYKNLEIFYANSTTGDLTITGNFSAYGGNIGGWHVEEGLLWAIRSENGIEQKVSLSADPSSAYCIFAGHSNAAKAPFSVKYDGTLFATSGTIAGWKIGTDILMNESETLRLITKGPLAGLLFVANNDLSVERSKYMDGISYILYQYTTDMTENTTAWNDCYHTTIQALENNVTMTLTTENNVTGGTQFNNYEFWHEVTVPVSVQPRYKIYKTVTDTSNESMAVTTTTTYVGWVSDESDTANDTYAALPAAEDPRIVKYIPEGESTAVLLEYDVDTPNVNAINNTVWFSKLSSAYEASATTPISIPDLESGTVTIEAGTEGSSLDNYVIYNTKNEWQKIVLDANISSVKLRTTTYSPTFSVSAAKGELRATYGVIGNFTINDTDLSNGTLTSSYLAPSNYITIRQKDGSNVQRSLEEIGQAFFDLKIDSKKGMVTMIRLNGDEVNFKTAALKATKAANAAAGLVKDYTIGLLLTDDNGHDAYGCVQTTVTTGSGSSSHLEYYLDQILTTTSYEAPYNNFYLDYDNHANYVKLYRKTSAGTYSAIEISDGGAYRAGQSDAGSGSAGNGSLTLTTNNNNNSKLNFSVTEYQGWFNNTISGKVDKPTLTYNNGAITFDFASYTMNNFITITNHSTNNNKVVLSTFKTNQSFEFTHGKYDSGWGAAYTNVVPPEANNNNALTNNAFIFKAPHSTVGELITYTYTISNVDNNKIKVVETNNKNNTSRTLGRFEHGKYDDGWEEAWNQVSMPTAITSNEVTLFNVLVPKKAVDGGLNTYTYYIMDVENNNANNRIKIVLRKNNDASTDTIVGRYIHNKYNLGWNACITALDITNHTINIDGIDYYQCPISNLPATIS